MSPFPPRCTEAGIMEGLSLPRSITRTILAEYEKEGIIECRDMGKSKPYRITYLRKAIQQRYVKFTRGEFEHLVGPIEKELEEGDEELKGFLEQENSDYLRIVERPQKGPRKTCRVVGNRPAFSDSYVGLTAHFVSQIQSLNPTQKTLFQLQGRIMQSATVESLLNMLPHLRQAFCLFYAYTGDLTWGSVEARYRLTKDLLYSLDQSNLPDPAKLAEEDIRDIARSLFTKKTKKDLNFLEPFIELVEDKGRDVAIEILRKNLTAKEYREIIQMRKLDEGEIGILKEDLWAVSMGLNSEIRICQFLKVEETTIQRAKSVEERLGKVVTLWEADQRPPLSES